MLSPLAVLPSSTLQPGILVVHTRQEVRPHWDAIYPGQAPPTRGREQGGHTGPGEFYSDPPSRGETLPFLSFLSVDGVIRPVRLLGRFPQDGRDLLVGVCSDTQSCPTLCDSWTVA